MNVAVDTVLAKGTVQGRALELLGSGVPQESVASALGVTAGYISQLLSNSDFADRVVAIKYETLAKHTARDAGYDALEDSLIEKLNKMKDLLLRPADILAAIKVINGAKRRGHDSTESVLAKQNIVEITMPIQIVQEFTTNITNQVIKAGDQDLITIQSGDLLKQAENHGDVSADNPFDTTKLPLKLPSNLPNESNQETKETDPILASL